MNSEPQSQDQSLLISDTNFININQGEFNEPDSFMLNQLENEAEQRFKTRNSMPPLQNSNKKLPALPLNQSGHPMPPNPFMMMKMMMDNMVSQQQQIIAKEKAKIENHYYMITEDQRMRIEDLEIECAQLNTTINDLHLGQVRDAESIEKLLQEKNEALREISELKESQSMRPEIDHQSHENRQILDSHRTKLIEAESEVKMKERETLILKGEIERIAAQKERLEDQVRDLNEGIKKRDVELQRLTDSDMKSRRDFELLERDFFKFKEDKTRTEAELDQLSMRLDDKEREIHKLLGKTRIIEELYAELDSKNKTIRIIEDKLRDEKYRGSSMIEDYKLEIERLQRRLAHQTVGFERDSLRRSEIGRDNHPNISKNERPHGRSRDSLNRSQVHFDRYEHREMNDHFDGLHLASINTPPKLNHLYKENLQYDHFEGAKIRQGPPERKGERSYPLHMANESPNNSAKKGGRRVNRNHAPTIENHAQQPQIKALSYSECEIKFGVLKSEKQQLRQQIEEIDYTKKKTGQLLKARRDLENNLNEVEEQLSNLKEQMKSMKM